MQRLLSPKMQQSVKNILKGRIALVTGGTGSFGKTIVKALLTYSPKEVRIFSRSEDKQDKMRFRYAGEKRLKFILGDVRDRHALQNAMQGVDFVFHAAAQKQVPASEYNVWEAVQTNVIGAQNVIDACFEHRVKTAIAISTDKAVEPVNAMGMTKALQEKLFVSANSERHRGACTFVCVRYGNVLGSTGSVLEVFQKQLKANTSLTITDERMTRFLITLDQAVELVLLALIKPTGGEIYIPKIQTHRVIDMANALIAIENASGPGRKTSVKITGIRPGEKLHETLISPSESLRTKSYGTHFVIMPQGTTSVGGSKKNRHAGQLFRYASDSDTMLTIPELKKILASHLSQQE